MSRGAGAAAASAATSTATTTVTRATARTSALEPELQAELTVLRVVEGAERRRRHVGLHVGRQERGERVVGADANPRLQLEDLEAALDADLGPRVAGEPELLVARADEIEILVHCRPRHA